MNRKVIGVFTGICFALTLCACGAKPIPTSEPAHLPAITAEKTPELAEEHKTPAPERAPGNEEKLPESSAPTEKEESFMLKMTIGETPVEVRWEDNASVEALKELCREEPLTISLSMYGGFEQVGPIGTSLPRSDVQTVTESGDIVLYSGNQIVVFYGSNTWAYTRLGHIVDRSGADMAALLGHGDVTITLRGESNE